MSAPQATGTAPEQTRRPALAGGLLVATGLSDVLAAYGMIRSGSFIVLGEEGLYPIDVTAWSWLHLVAGVAVALAGLVAITGRRGAATVAIGCAVPALAVDLLLLPYAPIRLVLVAALDVAAIRLLLRHRRATGRAG
ncbi:hypothetical protein ACFFMM_01140 [Micromonospora chaiyaphumensis]|uniref:DUF7144 domain-containing protein n=1 Tax=Micromonospora chaiyaphumensis TaxID=307119 RepID=A0A1C4Z713_9ACTN|nr:hypothetical protein [Micromonospora chaiyaphumensis]SCF28743.1 hypothetical protein GA0070214_11244 [Micromonospora chaiyaphumensis]